ncbi:helix-turn-helix transcriptional regulator [Embleya scabrispora]|uniref:helix-turn-helix transcriptional regulator n=1 Tax=Embleya scabrispora TaxID=159449 RepID=UPI00036D6550|nr:helix-turn-helix transcriptional regulator [Embleya scabrispora]MYS81008.1 helix-turn-helix domain-containing protein [Streptomyces sp. SID5474]
MSTNTASRRTELGAFLRSRRERRTPEDVGLPPGLRRRTPGLRREEVAMLAGVGVTWYTWLEQGRPINASVQVLDAVARTLGLDPAERTHLYRLAQVSWEIEAQAATTLPVEIQEILDGLVPNPTAVYNARYDVLAWNTAYHKVFPGLVEQPLNERNVIWATFMSPDECNPFLDREFEEPRMVAELQASFARHVGEPEWESFVQRLASCSPRFARLWARREVGSGNRHIKRIVHNQLGRMDFAGTRLGLSVPETRMVVYTPADDETRERMAELMAMPTTHWCCERCRRKSRWSHPTSPLGVATDRTGDPATAVPAAHCG